MKRLIAIVGFVFAIPLAAQAAGCDDERFILNNTMNQEEATDMVRYDLYKLTTTKEEFNMISSLSEHELFTANYVLYCTDLGKSNKIVYYLLGEL